MDIPIPISTIVGGCGDNKNVMITFDKDSFQNREANDIHPSSPVIDSIKLHAQFMVDADNPISDKHHAEQIYKAVCRHLRKENKINCEEISKLNE